MRIQRALARAGVASRRKAEELIAAGRVQVNGATAQIGQVVDPERDRISVDGKMIAAPKCLASRKGWSPGRSQGPFEGSRANPASATRSGPASQATDALWVCQLRLPSSPNSRASSAPAHHIGKYATNSSGAKTTRGALASAPIASGTR